MNDQYIPLDDSELSPGAPPCVELVDIRPSNVERRLRARLRQKQMRATEWHDISGVSGTLTGVSHFSMNWTLPEEEEKFLELRTDAVEEITGEFEDSISAPMPDSDEIQCLPGAMVPRSGWWHSPAFQGEQGFRYFKQGSKFPVDSTTEWGMVFWYYDPQRQK
jgi:hypothetical protein